MQFLKSYFKTVKELLIIIVDAVVFLPSLIYAALNITESLKVKICPSCCGEGMYYVKSSGDKEGCFPCNGSGIIIEIFDIISQFFLTVLGLLLLLTILFLAIVFPVFIVCLVHLMIDACI